MSEYTPASRSNTPGVSGPLLDADRAVPLRILRAEVESLAGDFESWSLQWNERRQQIDSLLEQLKSRVDQLTCGPPVSLVVYDPDPHEIKTPDS